MTALIAAYTGDSCVGRCDAMHEPLFECGGSAAGIQGRNRYAVRETLAC